jgi:hypothetical protein
MTSKMLHVEVMKDESEFVDIYSHLIWKDGIPFALHNVKSRMSQRVKDIHME